MKPVDFDYAAPRTVPEALAQLKTWGADAKILAGGQSLMPLLVARTLRPKFVIDINRIAGLDTITERDGGLVIGATVRQSEAHKSPLVKRLCPLLAEALGWVGTPQIRNLGTVVGSLTQRNVISEIPTVAAATGATLKVVSSTGRERIVKAAEFLNPADPATLQPDELVTEAWFPAQTKGTAWAFMEVQRRQAHYALVGVAAAFQRDASGLMTQVQLAASGISTRPITIPSVVAALTGKTPGREVFKAAAQLALTDPTLNPLEDIHATAEYRRTVTPVMIERTLMKALERLG
jgi:CO/xanthine dehydrogenase FAD-binding subunit